MFIELHMLDDNEKMLMNINKIQSLGQMEGIVCIDVGDSIFRVRESYDQICQVISKITMIEKVESEDNENGND